MMTLHTPLRCSIGLLAITLLSGCANKEPTGQVVAFVDGEEVTRRDLATEPMSGTGSESQPALLSGVIDRKLAAAEARRLELDRTPEYVAQSQRVEEVMLSRTLFERWAAEMPAPSPQALAQYIAGNPQRFDQRKLFLVDRIQASGTGIDRQALEPLQTSDAVAKHLEAQSRPFRRGQTVLDSATVPPELYKRLTALPKGYPLAIAEGDALTVLAVLQARDAPLPQAERTPAAVSGLKQAAVRDKLAALRKGATIAYQPGFRPPATAR
jgi:EpsD family peptidyl-prolyl cis-trans isomerase